MITADSLRAAIGCSPSRAAAWAPPLGTAAALFGIDTPARIAGWLAQIGHESGRLVYCREIWGPTAAQLGYEGRKDLGNLRPGDGRRFLGRGPIQITGRDNYRRLCQGLAARMDSVPDFELSPELVEVPRWGALAAAWFWAENDINRYADCCDIDGMSDLVNRGRKTERIGDTNGYADRLALFRRASAALGVA